MKKYEETAEISAIDHLIAADHALAGLGELVADPARRGTLHTQDLREWLEQLRARLDAVAV